MIMTELVFITMIVIITGSYFLEQWLDYQNLQYTVPELPDKLKDVFDDEEYRKSQLYKQSNTRFSFISSTFSLILLLVVLLFGLFGVLERFLMERVDSYYLFVLLFFGIIGILSDLLSLPFSVYDTFVLEERFGFNRTTVKTFITDHLKGWILTALIAGGILLLITWLYRATGSYFWLLAWGVITLFSLFMSMFYSNLIVPLFNKQTPLEEGDLRDRIEAFARKAGYNLSNIYLIDGSRRSSKANAYFTGLGPKKRIVLYDTLVDDLENEEIVAVLAHEIGHYKKRHTMLNLVLSTVHTGIMLYLFSLFVEFPVFSRVLGGSEASFHMGLIAFGIIYTPVSTVLGILMNKISRKHEYQADEYAGSFGLAGSLISSLKKLTRNNLSNLTPHPAYVFFHYSHPPLLQRIENLDQP